MTKTLNLIICGFTGKMGKSIAELTLKEPNIQITGACTHADALEIGQDIGPFLGKKPMGVTIEPSLEEALQKALPSAQTVVLDFTSPQVTATHVKNAIEFGVALLVGTTGLTEKERSALQDASHKIPVLVAANTSLGGNLLYVLSHLAARVLNQADVEISEVHHRAKKDSPSGTALYLGEAVAKGRGQELSEHLVLDRTNHGERQSNEIGIVGMRGGNVKGDHTVHFFGNNETLELKHHISDRTVFAEGALKAAWYLTEQKAGLYNMLDVLDIKLI